MLIEALSTYIKALGEKTYSILSNSNNNESETDGLMGDIEYKPELELIDQELIDHGEVRRISDIETDDIDKE